MKNLIGHLMQQPPATLRSIAANWQVELRRPTHGDNVRMLAEEILDERSIRYLLETLSPTEVRILEALISQEHNSLTTEQLEEQLSLLPGELEAHCQRLVDFGVAYMEHTTEGEHSTALCLPREVGRALRAAFRELRSTSGPLSAREHMRAMPTAKVEALAALWGATAAPGPYYQEELIEAIADGMQKPESLEAVVSKLDKGTRALFNLVVEAGGSLELAAVRARLELKESMLRFHLRELARRLLAVEYYRSNQRVLYIPQEIRECLCYSSTPSAEVHELTELVVGPTLSPYAIAWDLLTLLNLVYQEPSMTAFQARTVRILSNKLWLGGTPYLTDEYIDFLTHLARSLNLLVEHERHVTLGERLKGWIEVGFQAQIEEMLRLWINERRWLEPVFRTAPNSWGIDVPMGRRKLLDWLHKLPSGRWLALPSLLRVIREADPFILRPRREIVRLRGKESLDQLASEWDQVEGRLISGILSTSLQWLGIVRVGETASGTKAVMVTELGHGLLTGSGTDDPPQPRLVVQPNFEVTVLSASAPMVWQLLKFADPVRYDQAALYTITRDSVLKGVEMGMSVEEMLKVLRDYSAREIPQNVAYSMADWARLFKPARLERVVLLETEDPDTLEAILSCKIFCRYPYRRIGQNLATIQIPAASGSKEDPLHHLVRRLRKEGFFASLR